MKTCILIALAICFSTLFGAFMQDYPIEQMQPDGSKLSLLVTGDEYNHNLHDQMGYTVLIHPRTGYAVYAVPDGRGIKASEYVVGRFDPVALNIQPGLKQELAPDARADAMQQNRVLSHAPTSGVINNIVIFIRFLDQVEYSTPIATYDTMFNSGSVESVKGFFQKDSANQLTFNSAFYPAAEAGIVRSFQDGHNRSYFLAYNPVTNPGGYSSEAEGRRRVQLMMSYAVNSVAASVPSGLNVDGNNDGLVDNVTFVIQGSAEPVWGSPLWAQQYWLDMYGPLIVPYTYINGKLVSVYTLQLSDQLVSPDNGGILGTGVVCHETSHALGFPDLYHYSQDGNLPVGAWELMGSNGFIPQPHSVYMKMKYGNWVAALPTITPTATPTTYTLPAINDSPYACYKIASSTPTQFYVVEYRRAEGAYGSGMPGSGLIVYRITTYYQSGIAPIIPNGNGDGPPEEVYIYRPDGTFYNYGSVNNANFSRSVNRSSLHNSSNPTPWLYNTFATEPVAGNLCITDVTENSGATISFTLHGLSPHIWTGNSDNNWFNASNWNMGSVPGIDNWVEIPQVTTNYPYINGSAEAKRINLHSSSHLLVGNGSLIVANNMLVSGELIVSHANADVNIAGDLVLHSGGKLNYTANGYVHVQGDTEFQVGSTVNNSLGYLDFYGNGDSRIVSNVSVSLGNLIINKNHPYLAVIGADSSHDLKIMGNLVVNTGGSLGQDYSGNTIVKGSFAVNSGANCYLSNGTLLMQGFPAKSINISGSGSYLHHLSVDCGAGNVINLNSDIRLKGNLSISSGSLYASNHTMQVGGNWTNQVGTDGFFEGQGTVTINGTGDQYIGSESFYRLELNKSSGVMNIPLSVSVFCYYYNWTAGQYSVDGGNFTVGDLDDPGIFGVIHLSSGNIEYHQDEGSGIDLRAELNISGGSFVVYGGMGDCYLSYIDDASLTMNGGILDVKDWGFVIPDMPGFSFIDNISGGYIRCVGSFSVEVPDFNPAGGIVELYGDGAVDISMLNGSGFNNLLVNKNNNECSVNMQSPITVNGDLIVNNGMFYTNSHNLTSRDVSILDGCLLLYSDHYCSGNLSISGRMDIYPSYHLYMGANKEIRVNDGGYLYVYGNSSDAATISRYGSSGHYGFNVEWGGSIAAEYAVFEYMDAYGLNIKAGALVDPYASLNYCTFRNGSIAGRLLTLNNSQVFSVIGAVFPSNTWNGAYNVAKDVSRGSISFVDYNGEFSGEAYELDNCNGINWQESGVPGINSLEICYIYRTNSVQLTWDYPYPYTRFKIYRSNTPTGTFSYVGQTTTNSWLEAIQDGNCFYRVSVEH